MTGTRVACRSQSPGNTFHWCCNKYRCFQRSPSPSSSASFGTFSPPPRGVFRHLPAPTSRPPQRLKQTSLGLFLRQLSHGGCHGGQDRMPQALSKQIAAEREHHLVARGWPALRDGGLSGCATPGTGGSSCCFGCSQHSGLTFGRRNVSDLTLVSLNLAPERGAPASAPT